MSQHIGVTGATGFIGRNLVRDLSARGFAVTAFQRTPPHAAAPRVHVRTLILPDRVDPADFAGLDVLVHGAFVEYGPDCLEADAINREGTRRVVAAAREHGTRVVYLSTMSAHPGALSHYGRNKLELEEMFDPERDAILKLGLVLGAGGLFGSMAGLLRNVRVVPLPGSSLKRHIVVAMRKGESGEILQRIRQASVQALREVVLPQLASVLPHCIDNFVIAGGGLPAAAGERRLKSPAACRR